MSGLWERDTMNLFFSITGRPFWLGLPDLQLLSVRGLHILTRKLSLGGGSDRSYNIFSGGIMGKAENKWVSERLRMRYQNPRAGEFIDFTGVGTGMVWSHQGMAVNSSDMSPRSRYGRVLGWCDLIRVMVWEYPGIQYLGWRGIQLCELTRYGIGSQRRVKSSILELVGAKSWVGSLLSYFHIDYRKRVMSVKCNKRCTRIKECRIPKILLW